MITGPESSGKTTLAQALALHYDVPCVHEASRPFLETRQGGHYEERDLLAIAHMQLAMEEASALFMDADPPHLFCDTDLITIRIWGEEKYGSSDPWIVQQTEERHYDLWLLCTPDMPWEPDPLRENPNDRDRLFRVYESTLQQLSKPYVIMHGPHEQRMYAAIRAIDALR